MKDEKGKFIPEISSELRQKTVQVPETIYQASGIMILNRRIKSLLFSTDIAVIKNSNANSIMAVYPFTPQLSITQAIIEVAPVPVFVGVGGGITTGNRSIHIALQAELLGAYGVVVNVPMKVEVIKKMSKEIDIPIISTVVSEYDEVIEKIKAGVQILNVSGGKETPLIVKKLRQDLGAEFPIIATGGPTDESILRTIEAGANAITYTPPTSANIFEDIMVKYREEQNRNHRIG
ncbi:hydrolase [Treponema sp. OMZ 788]|uniref:hypothetical protein n=1 Tax=unclassified Treponema TaxID=2638727 RepID=UPI0020A4C597|nr:MULTISPECIES: hypothetical protein [unclassified Treponema]UTC62852.1 hydrolase [Treponema sp. OMZ 787]UTC64290.1 hydrolase [Treponema sp. OMZ 788]